MSTKKNESFCGLANFFFPVLLANLVNDVLSSPSKTGRISRDIKPVSELVIPYPLNIIW